MHEGDYDEHSKNEIKMSIRSECRNLIRFQELDSCDFVVPEHIDIDKYVISANYDKNINKYNFLEY